MSCPVCPIRYQVFIAVIERKKVHSCRTFFPCALAADLFRFVSGPECARRSSPSGGPNQVWREATAHQRVGRRAKTAAARSRVPSQCVAPFFASSVGSSRRRNCGRSRSERHGCLIGGESILLKLTSFLSLLQGLVCDKLKRRQSERIAGAGSLSFFML